LVWYKNLDRSFFPFCHSSRVWRTDGRTDRRTDRILIAIPRLHYMQRGNKTRLNLGLGMEMGINHCKWGEWDWTRHSCLSLLQRDLTMKALMKWKSERRRSKASVTVSTVRTKFAGSRSYVAHCCDTTWSRESKWSIIHIRLFVTCPKERSILFATTPAASINRVTVCQAHTHIQC